MPNPIRAKSILILLILSLATTVTAHREPAFDGARPGPQASEIERTSERLDPTADGWINRESGAVAILLHQNAGPYQGSPESIARDYLRQEAARFGLSFAGDDLLLDRVQQTPAGHHVRFTQSIASVPVWRSDLIVSIATASGRVRAVTSAYDPILAHNEIATTASLPAGEARSIALAALGLEGDPHWIGEPTEKLWIVRDQDRVGSPARLAWRVTLPIEEPMGDWELFVDAVNGSILRLSDSAVYVDGSGYVFDPDPLTTAEVSYGGDYSDNSDTDNAALNAERFLVTLRDLTFTGGQYELDGPYVELIDFESPGGAPVNETDPDNFTYTRSQQGFEDVMCYYFLDTNQRYIQSLGFFNIQNGPIGCDPHGLNGADNSHYIPSTNRVAFGEGGVDDDEDVDVVIHEYGHAIQHDIVSNWGGGEQGSMGEGFGDYWAGSYSAGVSLFRWEWVFNWDGHNNFWAGRVLNTTKHYPENMSGSIHANGEIWSAPWMQIWFECGQTVADRVILQHHFYQGGSATMATAAAFAMQADLDLYDGLHAGSLDYYFTERGFFSPSDFDVPELTHTPLGDQGGGGPYPITVLVDSDSPIVTGGVRVRHGIDGTFESETLLIPTGQPNEWGGAIPGKGGDVNISYYVVAENQDGWTGAHPRGADYQFHQFYVEDLTAIGEPGSGSTLALMPAQPNPFSPSTSLRFSLPNEGAVRLSIHDLSGRAVRTLEDRKLPAGTHQSDWNGRDDSGDLLPAGLYFAHLLVDGRTLTRKVVLAK